MGIYALIASVLLYAGIVKTSSRFNLGVVLSGITVAVGSFAFHLLFSLPPRMGHGLSFFEVIEMSEIVTFVLQVIISIIIFYKLNRSEESTVSWVAWVILGVILLFIIAPFLAVKLMSIL